MSSSPYQVLDNRPLDQWKVTELKEELKKRRLTIRGLKEDLVKRLDEAVRIEREAAQEEDESSQEEDESPQEEPEPAREEVESAPPVVEKAPETEISEDFRGIAQNDNTKTEEENNLPFSGDREQGNIQEGYILVEKKETTMVEETTVHETVGDGTTVTVTENVVSDVQITKQDSPKSQVLESEISEPQPVSEHPEAPENDESKIQLENENTISQLENEHSKPKSEEVVLENSAPECQVSEVSHNLGSEVKYDSISTDSVPINEKIEIKDNIIADNVKLELANNKPEMVPPSSSPRVNSHPHAMDVEEPHESNTPIDDKDDVKKFDSVDVGDSEKLNLDRSSGDDSMEEDVPESKQVESKYRSDDLEDDGRKIEVSDGKKEAGMVDIMGDEMSVDIDKISDDDEKDAYTVAEKRKHNDQPLTGNNEPAKRQRRWNSETLKVPEPQSAKLTVSTTPKESTNRAPKGDSNTEDALKERVVPPSPKSPTDSLKIDRFLRPFTLKAVQELLGKTGKVTSFWMDHIKTHCYVTYSSVEEAMETRNALYNLQWPPNGGRLLLAEFVDPQEVKIRVEAPPPPVVSPAATAPSPPGPSPRLLQVQKPTPAIPSLPPPPPLLNPPQARERVNLPPPPPLPESLEPPIVTLDDLFRKTRATPRIYYLPLSDEQVAGKAGRGTKM